MEFISYNDVNVLTTEQLSNLFNVEKKIVTKNFLRNKERYVEGEHYFVLTKELLKDFKKLLGNPDYMKFISTLYLWTEKGCMLHAKSCKSEEAWKIFEKEELNSLGG